MENEINSYDDLHRIVSEVECAVLPWPEKIEKPKPEGLCGVIVLSFRGYQIAFTWNMSSPDSDVKKDALPPESAEFYLFLYFFEEEDIFFENAQLLSNLFGEELFNNIRGHLISEWRKL